MRKRVLMLMLVPLHAAGAAQTERQSVSAAAAVDHMTRDEAFAAMETVQPLRSIMRDGVFNYWVEKRKRAGKPFIRRLWAPTSASDQNPFGVFRWASPYRSHYPALLMSLRPTTGHAAIFRKQFPTC